jgi:hypothetical protein
MKWAVRGCFGVAVAVTLLVAGCGSSPSTTDRTAAATAAANASISTGGSYGANEAIQTLALPPSGPLKPNLEYAQFPRYIGKLGDKQIEMKLGAKTDEPSGVHGEYRFAGASSVIYVAGDLDGGTLEIEESNDGTRITGNWVGKVAADGSISGERMDADDSNPQPFDLKPAVAGVVVPSNPPGASTPARPASPAPSLEPAPPAPASLPPPASATPPSSGHAVGGVGNVIIGE